MAGYRRPGPLGLGPPPRSLEDGTLYRGLSFPPGLAGIHADRKIDHSPARLRLRSKAKATESIESAFATLRRGSQGGTVKRLQRYLNARLSPSPQLDVDGTLGPLTLQEVIIYQRGVSIEADGVVGRNTWHNLLDGQVVTVRQRRPEAHIGHVHPAAKREPEKPEALRKPDPPIPNITVPTFDDGLGRSTSIQAKPLASPKNDVGTWSLKHKFTEVVNRLSLGRLKGQALKDWQALDATTVAQSVVFSLVLMALFACLTGGAALVLGVIALGLQPALTLASAIQITILAESDHELDQASDELAQVVIQIGVTAFLAGIVRIAGPLRLRMRKLLKGGDTPAPAPQAPPSGAPLKAPAPKPAAVEKPPTTDLYHGSKDMTKFPGGKLDPNYEGHFYCAENPAVAENAIASHASFDQAPAPGMLKSSIPTEVLDSLIQSGDVEVRSGYKGFGGQLSSTQEYAFKTPEAKAVFNSYLDN